LLQKITGEANSRNKALDLIRTQPDELVAMQDRDVVHINIDNYERALDFMEEHPNYGAVTMMWKDYTVPDHIRMSALILRKSAMMNFKFRWDYRKHLCATMVDDLAALGWIYDYLITDKKIVQEL
jgi:hypothetical protein